MKAVFLCISDKVTVRLRATRKKSLVAPTPRVLSPPLSTLLSLEEQVDLSSRGVATWSPVHAAAYGGHTPLVEFILRAAPGDATAVDQNGSQPIHYAALEGHESVTDDRWRAPSLCCLRGIAARKRDQLLCCDRL